jgi:hypothetical protein
MKVQHIKALKALSSTKQPPEVEWANSRKLPKDALRTLGFFCRHCGLTPTQLLELQTKARKSDDPDAEFAVLDLLKKCIGSIEGRKGTKVNYISTVRSFFDFHHRPLPEDKTWIRNIKSDRGRVEGKVNMDVLTTFLDACRGDPRKRSMFLVQLQSFSGPRELCIIGNEMGPYVAGELKKGANVIDLYFDKGRKQSDKGWHTYIGKDACDALREWFAVRGYPTKEDPLIWPGKRYGMKGSPLTTGAVGQVFARLAGRLGYRPKFIRRNGRPIPPIGGSHSRYGVSVKELRDLSLSLSQRAVGKENELGEAFQKDSAEYFAGHTIDALGYRKLHQIDAEYRRRQYELVEPYVSPISGVTLDHEKTKELEAKNRELEARLERLEAISVERLVLAAATKKQATSYNRERSTRNK